jgi:hypothetical protein
MLVRRHLVLVVGLVLAVATGIALGAGPLSHDSLLRVTAEPTPQQEAVDPGPSSDDLAELVGGSVRGARLEGRRVALLATPGADDDVVDALAEGVTDADGTVVARWTAGQSLVAPGDKALVDTLGSQLLEQLDGKGAGQEASAYRRMGQLLGTAIATRGVAAAPGQQALTIRQSIDAASLLASRNEEPQVAPLVLVVLGEDLDDHVVADLVSGLADRAAGVVVAAPERKSDLAALDELGTVTTVDGISGATGRLAAVLALAGADTEPGGAYGASGSDGLLPLG